MSHFLCIWQECLLTLLHPSGAQKLYRIRQFCRARIHFPSSCVAFPKFTVSTGTLQAAQTWKPFPHPAPETTKCWGQTMPIPSGGIMLLVFQAKQWLWGWWRHMGAQVSSKSNSECLTTISESLIWPRRKEHLGFSFPVNCPYTLLPGFIQSSAQLGQWGVVSLGFMLTWV